MKALILAAGVGQRLGEAADGRPKALLTFGGKTLLRRHVELLAAAGVDEVVIGVGYRAAAIEAELARIGSEKPIRSASSSIDNPAFSLNRANSDIAGFMILRAPSGEEI